MENKGGKKTAKSSFEIVGHDTDVAHTFFSLEPSQGNRILVVEDEIAIRKMIEEYLLRGGYQVRSAADGVEAKEIISQEEFDLIITDLFMPRMDGFALMRVTANIQPLTPIIILSGQGTFETAIRAIHMGAYDFVTKPVIDFKAFKICIDRALESKGLRAFQKKYLFNLEKLIAQQTQELIDKNMMLQDYADQLEVVSISIISSLQVALEEKDKYTAGHSQRVTNYSRKIGRKLDLRDKEIWNLSTAAQLHDIGKLMIDLSFMNRPGPLSDEEWKMMKRHPVIADRILAPLPFLDDVRPIIRHHHERLDGSGYPDGLVGDEIDQLTQILAVADSFDAMTSHRSYRARLQKEEAVAELKRCAGILFQPEVIQGLVAIFADQTDYFAG
ncbi:MAG: response regulator [Deltaproteobacteria bacterium]|nr:response regulator [Deltaproteobacteria bacterium]MBW2084766.1 response regulator [Deltaproteobacteria bacterium]